MGNTVWASAFNSPVNICSDASLPDANGAAYPNGTTKGQAGWDVGVRFNGAAELVTKVGEVRAKRGLITRLAINAHGGPGEFDIDSRTAKNAFGTVGCEGDRCLDMATVGRYEQSFRSIASHLAADALVLLMGCNVAAGPAGTRFMAKVSEFFRPRKVVGFTTVGISVRQAKAGGCNAAGMRDTEYDRESTSDQIVADRESKLLKEDEQGVPPTWASESSPHAKIAQNGAVIKDPDAAMAKATGAKLPGRWSVEIGGWRGLFVFGQDMTVTWANNYRDKVHPGKWWTDPNGDHKWQFSDDPKGWERTFVVPAGKLNFTCDGDVLPKGRGFFKMTRTD